MAIKKSFLFSSDPEARSFLQRFHWKFAHGSLKVLTSFRDLGAHLNVGFQRNGATLTSRMQNGLPKLFRVGRLPYPSSVKSLFVCNGVFSGCFYGCEATHVNESVMHKLTTAVSHCLAPEAPRRSNVLLFSCFDRECDPFAYVLVKRLSMLRRMLVRYSWLDEQVSAILSSYWNRGFPGTASAAGKPASPIAPWFGDTARAEWKTKHFPMGPVGYLLYSAAHFGLSLDQAYNVYQGNEVPYNMLTCPFQYLKPLVRAGVFRRRSDILSRTRTEIAGVGEVDFNTLRCTLQREKGKKFLCSLWHATLAGSSLACGRPWLIPPPPHA